MAPFLQHNLHMYKGTNMEVSASNVTPTDRWLSVWCIWYTTLIWKHFRSVEVVVGLVELFRISGRRVCRGFLMFCLETKMLWRQTPSRKKKAVEFTNVTANAYQGRLNAGFSEVCKIFNVRGIESLKYIRECHTLVCYCGDIFTPWKVTLNKTNCDWLFDMSVKRPHGRALTNERGYSIYSRPSAVSLKVWLCQTTNMVIINSHIQQKYCEVPYNLIHIYQSTVKKIYIIIIIWT